jgi:hypothetical protein
MAEHVPRDHLSLALSDNPMLDSDPLFGISIRIARDISGSEDAFDAGFEEFAYRDSVFDSESGVLCKFYVWADTDARDYDVGVDPAEIVELYTSIVNGTHAVSETERDTFVFVHFLDQGAELLAEDSLEWEGLRSDDIHFESTRG